MPLDESVDRSAVVDARRPTRGLSNRTVAKAITLGFLSSNLLFATRLTPLAALLVVAGCIGVWRLLASAPRRPTFLDAPLKRGHLAICLALALALFVLGGETHLFFANVDWLTRDAVLADLTRTWLLPAYVQDGARYLLRAPLGFYMMPAAAGKIFGLPLAHVTMLAQDTLIFGSILYLIRAASSGWLTIATVLLWGGFTGLQRLVPLLQHKPIAEVLAPPMQPLDAFFPYRYYTSSITQLFWVPNHALPGWWIAVLLILYAEAELDLAVVASSVGALTLWSPLVVLAAIPSVFARFRPKAWIGEQRCWWGVTAALCFLPVAIYLVASAGSIDHYVMVSRGEFPALYPIFLLIELPAAIFVACNIKRLRKPLRNLFWISLAFLIPLPLFWYGPGNDLVMRSSTAPIAIVAFCMGEVLFGPNRPRLVGTIIGMVIIAIGSIPAAGEIGRALTTPPYPFSDCTLMQTISELSDGIPPANYVVRPEAIPRWLVTAPKSWPRQGSEKSCWPTFPLSGQLTSLHPPDATSNAPQAKH